MNERHSDHSFLFILFSKYFVQHQIQQVAVTMPRRKKEELLSDGEDGQLPVQRNAANARERARMRVLSKAFVKLKTTLPWVPSDTKLSKLDTLRLAASYIAHLRQVLEAEDEDITEQAYVHPINLVSIK